MKRRRTCALCEEHPARKLEATSRDGKSRYTRVPDEAVFCSVRCAANWGLIRFATQQESAEIFWCPLHGWTIPTQSGQCGEDGHAPVEPTEE